MTLTKSTKLNIMPLYGEVVEDTLNEPGADEAEALVLTVTHEAEAADWTYSATAEDNGTAGILDGQPGIIYKGPDNNFARVAVADVDSIEGASAPEATDKAALAVYINSDLFQISDEGFTANASEIAVEHNLDVNVGPLMEDDVIRLAFVYSGEEVAADLDIDVGVFSIT